jgi:hypothetical protein
MRQRMRHVRDARPLTSRLDLSSIEKALLSHRADLLVAGRVPAASLF